MPKITQQDAERLFDQVLLMHKTWAKHPMNSDAFARTVNGLFEIGKEIDEDSMMQAFADGTTG